MTDEELTELLGWCACGEPQEAEDFLFAALSGLALQPDRRQLPAETGRDWFVMYEIDKMGLTEHGTAINWSWPTPLGYEVIEALKTRIEARKATS